MIDVIREKFILNIPKASFDLYFTPEVITFLTILILLLMGVMTCFWGYKYIFTLIAIVFGCFVGILGLRFLDGRITNPILMMFLYTMFVFLAECVLYGIYSWLVSISINLRRGIVINKVKQNAKIHPYMYILATSVAFGFTYMILRYVVKYESEHSFLWAFVVMLSVVTIMAVSQVLVIASIESYAEFCKKVHSNSPLNDLLSYASPFMGALIFSGVIYFCVFRSIILCFLLAVGMSIGGFFYQKKKNTFKKIFYTYDDIYYGE